MPLFVFPSVSIFRLGSDSLCAYRPFFVILRFRLVDTCPVLPGLTRDIPGVCLIHSVATTTK